MVLQPQKSSSDEFNLKAKYAMFCNIKSQAAVSYIEHNWFCRHGFFFGEGGALMRYYKWLSYKNYEMTPQTLSELSFVAQP